MKFSSILFTKRSLVIFFISFVAAFLMAVIPHLKNLKTEIVSPKLEQKKDLFKLKKPIIPPVSAASDLEEAKAYAVLDFDSGEVIASKNLSKRLPVASLTKIMSAVVGLDLARPDEKFGVTVKAASQPPTKVMLKAGEEYKLENLLKFMLISSANDSAQVLGDGIDSKYGLGSFVTAMNMKVKFLGLKNTHFVNPQGYDSRENFSSAEDLGLLTHYALSQYPLIAQIVGQEYEDLTGNGADNRFYLNNWNGLLGVYPGVFGVKIGNTDDAGLTTIVGAQRDGKRILAVVLGAPGVLERDLWASQALDLGFQSQANLEPVNVTEQQLRDKYSTWKYF